MRVYSLFCLSFALLWLSGCSKPTPEVEQAKIVMVTKADEGSQQLSSYAGEIQARQQTALSFRVGGQITERFVDVGDRVRVGQVLAKLDTKDADLQLNAALAQLEQARSAEKNAQSELKRFQQLLPENAVSRSQYDAIDNQYKSAISNLKQAQANFEVAQNQTRYNQLIANKNGVITSRNIEVGQVVSAGQAAYQLAIDGDREVVIGVSEQAIANIKAQQQAWISLWSESEKRYEGFVREVSPAADQTRTFSVKVALKDRNAPIQLGQSARVFFNIEQHQQLSIPLASVSAINEKPYVWVVEPNNTLKRVWVTLGDYQREQVPVLSGLNADQWIVIGGVHLLREQQKIRPVDRDNRPVTVASKTLASQASPEAAK